MSTSAGGNFPSPLAPAGVFYTKGDQLKEKKMKLSSVVRTVTCAGVLMGCSVAFAGGKPPVGTNQNRIDTDVNTHVSNRSTSGAYSDSDSRSRSESDSNSRSNATGGNASGGNGGNATGGNAAGGEGGNGFSSALALGGDTSAAGGSVGNTTALSDQVQSLSVGGASYNSESEYSSFVFASDLPQYNADMCEVNVGLGGGSDGTTGILQIPFMSNSCWYQKLAAVERDLNLIARLKCADTKYRKAVAYESKRGDQRQVCIQMLVDSQTAYLEKVRAEQASK